MSDFNEKELGQILLLWKQHMRGGRKIDRRTISSRTVQQWAVNNGLALWRCNHGRVFDGWGTPPYSCTYLSGDEPPVSSQHASRTAENPCRWRLCFRELGDPFQSRRYFRFTAERHLPVEILWHYVRKFIYHENGETRGYSINACHGWRDLNVYEEGSRWDPKNKHADCRWQALNRLAAAGYIILQTAGSIWQITVLDRRRDG